QVYALDPAARAHLDFRETGPGEGWPADLTAEPGPASGGAAGTAEPGPARVCAAFHAGRSFLVYAPDSPLLPSGAALVAGT
ncbi:hypothetical protein QP363_13480, partial [Corynebacterium sp. UMB6689]|uniref:hypothetical protein n=1 Tax=Corynebacterium sp. UMB6689 TaxID=3046341 RepID=UPI00254BD3E8